ncbi:MAG: PQQ-binding-like beta-propeller repeat protein [Flavobacteriales bacterium]|nr:PQQ-binding-like beta-propeller repeat protein [Flavobacteriales bacterium]
MRFLTSLTSTALFFLITAGGLRGQTLEEHWWQPNGNVETIVKDDVNNLVYIGGTFTYIGPNTPYGSPVSTTTGMADVAFGRPNGEVRVSVPDGEGGWFIGGQFTQVNGQTRNRIARLNADGTLHPWNPGCNSYVNALDLQDGVLYIGGAFNSVGGQPRTGLAAVDANSAAVLALGGPDTDAPMDFVNELDAVGDTLYIGGIFRRLGKVELYGTALDLTNGTPDFSFLNPNGIVYDAIPDGAGGWYIAGSFSEVGGQDRSRIARLNADGTLHPWSTGFTSGAIRTMAISGNTIYVGGGFTTLGGQSRNRIGALDATTGVPTTWNPNSNDGVSTLAISGSTIYVGGEFTTIGGQTRNNIAALSISTGAATSWNPNADDWVYALAVSGSTIYVGGDFGIIGGQTRIGIAALNNTTGTATAWNPNSDGSIYSLAVSGSTVYAGGSFTTIGGQTRNNIAALNNSTAMATTWNPNANGSVRSLAINGSTIYAGGSFTSIGGQTRNRVAALNNTTGAATTWDPNADDVVRALAISGGAVYAGGDFTRIGLQNRNYIAALNVTTGALTAWNPNANQTVDALVVDGSTVYVGGQFTNIGGQARNRIAALSVNTGAATAWNPNANVSVTTLATSGSTVYAGGNFTTIGGQARNYIAALNKTTGLATTWNPNANSTVYAVAVTGSTVYAGGSFTSIGGQTRNYVAALNNTTGAATTWNPNAIGGSVRTLVINGNSAYVGGLFTRIGGLTRNRIAALDATTGIPTAWNPNANSDVETLLISGSTIYAGGGFSNIGGQPRNCIAALNTSTGAATTWNPNVSSSGSVVYTMAMSGSTIYAGGYFTTIGGQTRNNIAALNSSGLATSWNPNASYEVSTLAISGSTIYAGGGFTSIGGQTRNHIAALNNSTGAATTWNPNASDWVQTITISGSTIYTGGSFTTIGGQTRNRIAALNTSTGLATTWNPNASDAVYSLAISGSTIYAGGYFFSIGGQTRLRIAALNISNGLATTWNPSADQAAEAIATSGSSVYVGGWFSTIGGQARNRLAVFTPNSITTGSISSPICAGNTVSVPYTAVSTFGAGNIFTAQLSDATGFFPPTPVVLGSVSSTTSGTIVGTIDPGTLAGAGYRIRVVSSNPMVMGSDNGSNITINAPSVWYADADGDGFGDPAVWQSTCIQPNGYVFNSNDQCPDDADKTAPGICGCGESDIDTDADLTADCDDGCPLDANKTWEGICGCGVPDVDGDGDTVMDCLDGCPLDPNKIAPGICGCGSPDTDTDGDSAPDCNDLCPLDPNKIAPGTCGCGSPEPGTACNDGDPYTGNDVVTPGCQCQGIVLDCAGMPGGSALPGTPCNDGDPNTTNDMYAANCTCAGTSNSLGVGLTLVTDGNGAQTSWEIIPQGGGTPVCSGTGYANNATIPLSCTLANGCYELRVLDSFGDGMTTGGYVLRDAQGKRIIDNASDGAFTYTSQIASAQGFCLPLGLDRIRDSRCDLETMLPTDWTGAVENPAVSAQFGTGNQSDDGYQFWFFNPDGGYTRRILITHASGNYQFPAGPARCSYVSFSSIVTLPLPQSVLLNARVRSLVNGTYAPFGPACRMRISPPCQPTQLNNVLNSPQYSCGVPRTFGGADQVHCLAVAGANKYRFRFERVGGGYARTIAVGTTSLLLKWLTLPLVNGDTYNVTVQASFDGGATYCAYGPACAVLIDNAPGAGALHSVIAPPTALAFSIWPNPNGGDVLNLSAGGIPPDAVTADLSIIEPLGRPMFHTVLSVDNGAINTVVPLDASFASGVYFVTITAGGYTGMERLIVHR